jgi:hypothetical protein
LLIRGKGRNCQNEREIAAKSGGSGLKYSWLCPNAGLQFCEEVVSKLIEQIRRGAWEVDEQGKAKQKSCWKTCLTDERMAGNSLP